MPIIKNVCFLFMLEISTVNIILSKIILYCIFVLFLISANLWRFYDKIWKDLLYSGNLFYESQILNCYQKKNLLLFLCHL